MQDVESKRLEYGQIVVFADRTGQILTHGMGSVGYFGDHLFILSFPAWSRTIE